MSDQRTAPQGNPQLVTPQTPDKLSAKMLDMLSANMTAILEKSKNDDPVFFLEYFNIFDRKVELSSYITPMPFKAFWVACFEEHTKTTWYVHFVGSKMIAWSAPVGKPIRKAIGYNSLDANDWFIGGTPSSSRADQQQTALFVHNKFVRAVERINDYERSTIEPPALKRLNAMRHKAGTKRLAPFIVISSQPAQERTEHQGGGGWQQPPHSRRGHWRQYKSGKRIWIDNYSVHGGSDHGRHYRVAASS